LVGQLEEPLLFRVDVAAKIRLVPAFGEKLVSTESIELREPFGDVGASALLADSFGDPALYLRHSDLSPILVRPMAICPCWAKNLKADEIAENLGSGPI
jgi:hypothetical protein